MAVVHSYLTITWLWYTVTLLYSMAVVHSYLTIAWLGYTVTLL